MAKRRILRKLLRILIVVCVLVAAIFALSLFVMARKDKEHERFYKTGKSVNQFLANYKHGLEEAFKKKDAAEITQFYSEHYAAPGRGRWVLKPDQDEGDVTCFTLKADGQDYTKYDLKNEFNDYLKGLASIQDIKFKIDMIEKVELERTVQLTVKFILDGKDQRDAVFQDRNFYRWYLINEGGSGAYDWKIVKDALVEGVRVGGDGRDSQGFETKEELAAIGIDYKHERDPKLNIKDHGSQLKFGVIEHGGGGVSAVDYNNDGKPDIFFADGKRSRLYRNDGADASGRVHFTDVTTESGLDGIDQAAAGIFADVDNDGYQDLFVSRYLAPLKFYHNNGPDAAGKITFSDWSTKMGFDPKDPKSTAPAVGKPSSIRPSP